MLGHQNCSRWSSNLWQNFELQRIVYFIELYFCINYVVYWDRVNGDSVRRDRVTGDRESAGTGSWIRVSREGVTSWLNPWPLEPVTTNSDYRFTLRQDWLAAFPKFAFMSFMWGLYVHTSSNTWWPCQCTLLVFTNYPPSTVAQTHTVCAKINLRQNKLPVSV